MSREADRRVARGAALLDAKMPGWASRIDLNVLDLTSDYACVLGQLFSEPQLLDGVCRADYFLGTTVLGLRSHGQAEQHGFDTPWDNAEPTYPQLDAAWIKLIKARHDAGVA